MSIPVFSVTGLIAWLETQDPATEYEFIRAETCLLTKYFRSRGIERTQSGLQYGPIDLDVGEVWSKIVQDGKRTYGAALARAKEIVDAQ